MEEASEPGKINISEDTYEQVKSLFDCTHRGTQQVEEFGPVEMYFLNRIRESLSEDKNGFVPNLEFNRQYCRRFDINQTSLLSGYPHFIQNYVRQNPNTGGGKNARE